MAELNRVTDPSALDACEGARARLVVEVPEAWLSEGADLAITAPRRLPCARCDGGGCDACGRSGVLRAPEEAAMRVLHTRLPASSRGDGDGFLLRIPSPFGEACSIAQLLVEVRVAEVASTCVRRVEVPRPLALSPAAPLALPRPNLLWLAALVALAAALVSMFGR